jgi:hypothetical protein
MGINMASKTANSAAPMTPPARMKILWGYHVECVRLVSTSSREDSGGKIVEKGERGTVLIAEQHREKEKKERK